MRLNGEVWFIVPIEQFGRRITFNPRSILFAFAAMLIMPPLALPDPFYPTYEAHTTYIGNFPHEENNDWSDESQGLAHDLDHWYLTQRTRIWRAPVTLDLRYISYSANGVSTTHINDHSKLHGYGYDHLGDPDIYTYAGTDYLLVPIEGGSPGPGIAVFLADDLTQLVDTEVLSEGGAPWCALDPKGYLYATPFDHVSFVSRYEVDWDQLKNDRKLDLIHTPEGGITLYDENGQPLELQEIQGGTFSETGAILFLVSGVNGIHVFDVKTGRRLEQSCNGCGRFNYEFHPGWSKYEEAEGLTVWDLDKIDVPNVSGQLHVLMLDNDCWPGSCDDVYIKHYTHRQHLAPGDDVRAAHDQAWNGSAMSFAPGNYPQSLVLDRQIRLEAKGTGPATIGQ